MDWFISNNLTLSLLTLISLLVNAITIYRWISEWLKQTKINDQAFEMIRGLALAGTRRVNMVVRRISALETKETPDKEAIIFLENMYADAKSNIESLLATAKALRPDKADSLPFDGDALLNQSVIENQKLDIQRKENELKIRNLSQNQPNVSE